MALPLPRVCVLEKPGLPETASLLQKEEESLQWSPCIYMALQVHPGLTCHRAGRKKTAQAQRHLVTASLKTFTKKSLLKAGLSHQEQTLKYPPLTEDSLIIPD